MKRSLILFASLALAPLACQANETCSNELKSCLTLSAEKKNECFLNAGKSQICEKTQLGDLALKRWSLAPDSFVPDEEFKAFLGPELVDKKCIANFDNQLSSELIKGDVSTKQLDAALESCKKKIPEELLRP